MSASILDGLNEQQRAAVTAPDGPVLILAGPGSGKTRVLTHRIVWLVQERRIPPWRIKAMTFTNKAAREMRVRVEDQLGGTLRGLTLGTFHAICARILRREADEYLPLTRDFVIFDTSDQRALIKGIISDDLNLDDKRYQPIKVLGRISQAKNELISPGLYQPEDYFDEVVRRAYHIYQERLVANNALDFDDLLMYVAVMLKNEQSILLRYQQETECLLVDEFQDTNEAQYTILRQLAGARNNLFCVGDEDQSIYRWRGADYRNLTRLREDYPDLHTVLLEQNYRSTQLILDAAQAVIKKNTRRTHKNLFTDQQGGVQIAVHEAHDENFEARFVVEAVENLVNLGEVKLGECAVMYRTNSQSRVLEDAFVRANLPYRLVGATRFYSRKEIKDVLAYLRIIHNPNDSVSLNRIINTPPRGIGAKTVATLENWASRSAVSPGVALLDLASDIGNTPFTGRALNVLSAFASQLEEWRNASTKNTVSDLLKMVLNETRYIDYLNDGTDQGTERVENVVELLNLTTEYEELPLTTFLEEVALVSDVDNLDDQVNAPSLMTLHAAKGLEYDAVFLVGLEEGVLPHQRSKDDPEQMEEERRLMYVGMTRARKYLYLIHAFRRTVWGESSVNLRSRFLDDIPPDLMVQVASGSTGFTQSGRIRSRPPRLGKTSIRAEGAAFREGQRVMHPKFGEGIVIECRTSGQDQEISVVFEESGLKRLLASFANLTVLDA